ncbi:hypothetical protein M409DRAFT_18595 [Zasmidium cellare ATCC 36951]|uniref:Uncharacterized protein n=1 Tax=Zasmidium cellare ATCC 36951 TaxID=1080233 RepID=A0A6A6D072_ZASCE|nr:uncharacterized protein M409DRAFT_18595 [Zasmidium cellare ATCC 36951]KAF2171479.1 hypothetical protein M409DRAFT_18595 [Zasmidium cellare ATCC 36951]
MPLVCNKKWETKDTEETLCREILFQYCCSMTKKPELQHLSEKYGDRHGLPLGLWKHTPLRFSASHRAHESGMFTGWPSSDATDVQERINNDDNNNKLIEPWHILDTNIYNPGTATTYQDAIPSTNETIVIDDLEGAVLDESAVAAEGSDDDADAAGEFDGEKLESDEEIGETPAAGILPGSRADDANPDLQDTISQVYSLIITNDNLKAYLVVDRDFTRLVAHLQRAADGDVDSDAREYFDECMGQVYERYITPTQGG